MWEASPTPIWLQNSTCSGAPARNRGQRPLPQKFLSKAPSYGAASLRWRGQLRFRNQGCQPGHLTLRNDRISERGHKGTAFSIPYCEVRFTVLRGPPACGARRGGRRTLALCASNIQRRVRTNIHSYTYPSRTGGRKQLAKFRFRIRAGVEKPILLSEVGLSMDRPQGLGQGRALAKPVALGVTKPCHLLQW